MADTAKHTANIILEDNYFRLEITCPFDPESHTKPCSMWENPDAWDEIKDEPAPKGFIPGCGLYDWMQALGFIDFIELHNGTHVFPGFEFDFAWMGEDGIEWWGEKP